ncbi:hypothetical protein NDA16_000795 [Ustilago loliicola]|nr:hypothetical protein NDA16_005193 [Ustilago loliicola]KAJ1018017.1 hypothetical protein NDA16_004886 [Ustilago loliicola]KAJ1018169.1 hypothetical protein NDA16_005035 [Ustilago loliicola]KAJ1018517.1 hypothetical protein NDA16_004799 [Ustilago loliicola]KAJ1018602.1 hypothetical protein NDA16_004884 [Ustilago loliicola]
MNSAPHNVNTYNISLFPQHLLNLYHPVLTLQLVSHTPTPIIKDNPYFKDSIYFAQAAGLFKFNPSLKQPLLKIFMRARGKVQGLMTRCLCIKGKQTIAISQLVDYLLSAHEHHPQSRQDLPGQGAEMVSTFKGKNTARLCGNKKQVILDLFNALGWNTGHLKTTAFNSANASWLVLPQDFQPADIELTRSPSPACHSTYLGGASGPYQGLIHLGGNHYEILSL